MFSVKAITGLCLLTILVSCNDVSSNHRSQAPSTPKPDVIITPVEAGGDLLRSHLHREKTGTILSANQEITLILNDTLPESIYRTIPMMNKDDEGSEKNIVTRTTLIRPTVECGVASTLTGITSRIADCVSKNNDTALWDGKINGAAGESVWKLVSLSNGHEIWFDERTGMVWSDVVKVDEVVTFNWCKASGNTEGSTPTESVNCQSLGESISLCDGNSAAGLEGKVKWRLPTRNDYLQADLNGGRFVLEHENATGLWTATLRAASSDRSEAWVYHSKDGTLSSGKLIEPRQVRCIGAAVR